MNHVPAFEKDFQSSYIIELADYRARRKQAQDRRPGARRTPPSKPPHIVSLMNKALEWQRLLDAGEVSRRAEVARRQGITRARVTQIMKLLALAPDIREGHPRAAGRDTGEVGD
jgi:hypothetical protein